ncbi:hypothetical protein JL720_5235 [Aureococcus anophagefferens]|nr:hypothetical protein JL720_5235 [Aureococcus anophagefferens]
MVWRSTPPHSDTSTCRAAAPLEERVDGVQARNVKQSAQPNQGGRGAAVASEKSPSASGQRRGGARTSQRARRAHKHDDARRAPVAPASNALKLTRRGFAPATSAAVLAIAPNLALAKENTNVRDGVTYKKINPIQFVAALGDPTAAGTGAQDWGIWRADPGPRGVRLGLEQLEKGKATAGWAFDGNDWWLEARPDHEQPDPLPAGKYVVAAAVHGARRRQGGGWTLRDGSLYDVTHLPCRSARYTPPPGGACCPRAPREGLPVTPGGAAMPASRALLEAGLRRLFIVGVEDKAATAAATAAASLYRRCASEACLGTMTWGVQNDQRDADAQIDLAREHGVNFIDTAEMPVPRSRQWRA